MKLTAGKKPGGGKQRGKGGKNGKLGKVSKRPKSLKNQIRGVERLLRRPDLDPKMRARQEAKLEELKVAQAEHERQELERKYALKYHKVRFFERVKLERRLRRLQAQLAAARGTEGQQEAAAQLQQQIDAVQEDLQYVLHFPKGEKYVSLLRQSEDPAAQEQLEAERARLRALVKRQLAEAAMLAEADEGAALAKAAQGAGPSAQAADSAKKAAGVDSEEEEEEQDDFFLGSDDEEAQKRLSAPAAGAPTAEQPASAGSRPSSTAAGKRKLAQLEAAADGDASSDEEEEGSSEEEDGERSKGSEVEDGDDSGNEDDDPDTLGKPLQAALAPSARQAPQQAAGMQPRSGQSRHGRDARPQGGSKPWQQRQQQHKSGGQHFKQQHESGSKPLKQQQQQQGKPWKKQGGGRPLQQHDKGSSPAARKPALKPAQPDPKQPLRTRAEGGRKRRKRK